MLQGITEAVSEETRVICPMVSRHFDFLEGLVEGGKLDAATMMKAFRKTHESKP